MNEIVAVSILYYPNVSTSKNDDLKPQHTTIVRQWNNIPIPNGFKERAANHRTKLEMVQNERHLLNLFISMLHKLDPDVLVGHNFIGFSLDVLLHRFKALKIDLQWSKIGRLRRRVFPKLQSGAGGMNDSSLAERQVCSGRIICDTYLTSKDLVKSKNYSLAELSFTQLNFNRIEIDHDKITDMFWNLNDLYRLIDSCECDTWLSVSLMFKMQVLGLTLQLTKLAGNLWTRTMTGARAERNEFLLLHEFHEKKYLVPDKVYNDKEKKVEHDDDEGLHD